ncbi:unnamed protein product [Danaus chrysippus]|uniref:(African queen) hypothetical protein n=1 Tax=Danaus chrysippus TaxID=151541 RepID=A0A8J2R1D0_9NEOP|nr:unnamed protein product [Danaus chrysippus]
MSVEEDSPEYIIIPECLSRCKCCFDDNNLKSMWDAYSNDGDQEVYGDMIGECFAISWETHEQSDLICEMCVIRLREALTFKRNILATHELLQEAIDMKDVKQFPSIDVEMETQVKEEWIEDGNYNDGIPDAFEDVEYLDEEDGIQTPEPKRKWPKKKKKSERLARYKQYSADDMRQAIKAVRNGEMTCTIAAITYGVPKKTLTAKANDKDRNEDDGKDSTSEKHYKLIEEIKNILKFTNAIPFKTKTTRYYCAYCSTDGPIFEDGDCLRLHTRLEHDKERLRGVEKFMRPQWMNEIVKLDIEGLHCTTCRVRLPDWNKMFVHFANAHNIEFDQAYTRVIPYALTSQLRCVLCKESFHNYGHVDSHMNHHYSNYICHQCGDTFLAASRFDKHLKVHKIGNYPCELCDKVFTLEKYRTKHKNLVHDQKSMVKCLYCSEKFVGLFQRHLHVTEHHKDKVKVYTCELCGNCYTWKTYFLAHMRRRHGTDKKHQCKHCDKSFLMKYELRNHMIRHTDEKFLCGLCGKSFKRMLTLKKHCLAHEEFSAED